MKSNIEEFPSHSNYEGTANKEEPKKLNLEKSGIEENSNLPIYSVPSFLNEEPIEKEDSEDIKPSCEESLDNVSIALNDFTNVFLSKIDALSESIDSLVQNIKTIKSPSFKSSSSKQVDDLDEVSTNDDESDSVTPPSEETEDSLEDKAEENTEEEENTEKDAEGKENAEKNKIVDKASRDNKISPQDISTVELIHKVITNINKDTDKKFKPHTTKLISLSKKEEYRTNRKNLTDNVALNIKELIHIKNKEIKDKESHGIFSILFNNGADIFNTLKNAFKTITSSATGKLVLGGGAIALFGGSVRALISEEMKRMGYPAYFIDNLIGKEPESNLYIGSDEAQKKGETDKKTNPTTSLITTEGGSDKVLELLSQERVSKDFLNKKVTLDTGIQNDKTGFDEKSIKKKISQQLAKLRGFGVTDVNVMRMPVGWTKKVNGKIYTAEDVNKILEKLTIPTPSNSAPNSDGFTADPGKSAFDDLGIRVNLGQATPPNPIKTVAKNTLTPLEKVTSENNQTQSIVYTNPPSNGNGNVLIHTTEHTVVQYIQERDYDATTKIS